MLRALWNGSASKNQMNSPQEQEQTEYIYVSLYWNRSSICHPHPDIQKLKQSRNRAIAVLFCHIHAARAILSEVSVKQELTLEACEVQQEPSLRFQIFEAQVHCKAVLLNCFDAGTNIGSTSKARRKQITSHWHEIFSIFKYSLMLLFQYYVVICILPFLFLFLIHGSCTLRRVPLQEPRHTSNVCSIESLQDPCPEFGVSVEKIKKKIIVQRCLFSGSWSLCGHRFLKVSSQELRKHVQLSAAAM